MDTEHGAKRRGRPRKAPAVPPKVAPGDVERLCRDALLRVIADDDAPHAAVVQAVRTLAEMEQIIGAKAAPRPKGRDVAEMSLDELAALAGDG